MGDGFAILLLENKRIFFSPIDNFPHSKSGMKLIKFQ